MRLFYFSKSRMPESKPVIGLSWEPKLPTFSSGTHNGSVNKSQNQTETSALWRPNSELVDGLFVPPNAPRKLNKLMRKQLKDTAGKSWYASVSTALHFNLLFFRLICSVAEKMKGNGGNETFLSLNLLF